MLLEITFTAVLYIFVVYYLLRILGAPKSALIVGASETRGPIGRTISTSHQVTSF